MTKALTRNAAQAIGISDEELSPRLRKLLAEIVREEMETHVIGGPDEIVRYKDLPKYTGLGKTATDQLLQDGRLRPGVPLSDGRAIGWFKSWLVEYQRSLVDVAEERAARRNAVTKKVQDAAAEGRERRARALRRRGKQAAAKSSKRSG